MIQTDQTLKLFSKINKILKTLDDEQMMDILDYINDIKTLNQSDNKIKNLLKNLDYKVLCVNSSMFYTCEKGYSIHDLFSSKKDEEFSIKHLFKIDKEFIKNINNLLSEEDKFIIIVLDSFGYLPEYERTFKKWLSDNDFDESNFNKLFVNAFLPERYDLFFDTNSYIYKGKFPSIKDINDRISVLRTQ